MLLLVMYLLYTVHVVYSGKTTRQRALDRQRDEEIREKKLAEEKRLREEKRLADEAARKKAIKDRKVSTLGCPSPQHPFCALELAIPRARPEGILAHAAPRC